MLFSSILFSSLSPARKFHLVTSLLVSFLMVGYNQHTCSSFSDMAGVSGVALPEITRDILLTTHVTIPQITMSCLLV